MNESDQIDKLMKVINRMGETMHQQNEAIHSLVGAVRVNREQIEGLYEDLSFVWDYLEPDGHDHGYNRDDIERSLPKDFYGQHSKVISLPIDYQGE